MTEPNARMSEARDVLDAYARTTLYALCGLHEEAGDEEGAVWTPDALRIAPDGQLVCRDCWDDYGDKAGGVVVDEFVTPHWNDLPSVPSLFDALRAERAEVERKDALIRELASMATQCLEGRDCDEFFDDDRDPAICERCRERKVEWAQKWIDERTATPKEDTHHAE